MQQGRIQLDADWNEQVDVAARFLQVLARDLIGPHGGPGKSFMVGGKLRGKTPRDDFVIHEGHYYVDGLLCENDDACTYMTQPDYRPPKTQLLRKSGKYLAYLDVWERQITALQDPTIREVALSGPDTATRAKIVWQVKLLRLGVLGSADTKVNRWGCDSHSDAWDSLTAPSSGRLEVRCDSAGPKTEPPEPGYTGLENNLYRVEIHDPGSHSSSPTFKWSRDNGSVVANVLKVRGPTVTVAPRAGTESLPFKRGDWVEVFDDEQELQGRVEPLYRVGSVDLPKMEVKLGLPSPNGIATQLEGHILMRRWDQKKNVITQKTPRYGTIIGTPRKWIPLEFGIQVRLARGSYRKGDYWLVPARIATRGVIWPSNRGKPSQMPPHGVEHHYCRLAILGLESNRKMTVNDCRRVIGPPQSAPFRRTMVFSAEAQ